MAASGDGVVAVGAKVGDGVGDAAGVGLGVTMGEGTGDVAMLWEIVVSTAWPGATDGVAVGRGDGSGE